MQSSNLKNRFRFIPLDNFSYDFSFIGPIDGREFFFAISSISDKTSNNTMLFLRVVLLLLLSYLQFISTFNNEIFIHASGNRREFSHIEDELIITK